MNAPEALFAAGMMTPSAAPTEAGGDLSALAWVQEELRRALEAAHKALRRQLKEAESRHGADVDAIDPAVLRSARAHLHQGAGALDLVNLPAPARVLRASEAAVQKFIARPHRLDAKAVEAIERASFALLEYLARVLAGKAVSPVAMFPQYRAVQELAGAERIHPADLWEHDGSWRELPPEPDIEPRQPDGDAQAEFEALLLGLMRGAGPEAAQQLSDLCAGLAAGRGAAHDATLWRLAAGFYEAQAHALLEADVYGKRVGSRLLAHLRAVEAPPAPMSERLAQDLIFLCAQCASPGDGRAAPRLFAVRQAYGLAHHAPVDYGASRLGRFDPGWIAQAKKRVALAKDAWSAVAGGEMHRADGLNEQFALVADSLRRLYARGDVLADELVRAVAQTVQQAAPPAPPLAMEIATAVLYLEASLEEGELDDPQLGARVERLAGRIAAVAQGGMPEPLEAWMEELYRRVSDRQTMGSVVQELRATLAEAEKHIDQFFRQPGDAQVLIPVPNQLAAMRGVLSVLGMDQAQAAVQRMREEIDGLIAAPVDPQRASTTALFERLAGNLGALSFLIDMLSVQPQLAKSLFDFDAERGRFAPVMGRRDEAAAAPPPVEPRLVEQAQSLAVSAIREDVPDADVARELERLSRDALAAEQPALAASIAAAQVALGRAGDDFDAGAAREQLALAMNEFVHSVADAATLEALPLPAPAPAAASGLEDDPEMRAVFIDEAREVIEGAQAALAALRRDGADLAQLTTVRRAFHTLKGSARMVGLADFGEAAWAFEQLYNARLAEAPHADEPLLASSTQALDYLGDWVERIAAAEPLRHDAKTVRRSADALRLEGRLLPLPLPLPGASVALPPPPAAPPAPRAAVLPPAAALDLEPAEPLPEIHLDLGALDVHVSVGEVHAPTARAPEPIEEPEATTRPMPLAPEPDEAPPPPEAVELIELDLADLDFEIEPGAQAAAAAAEAAPEPAPRGEDAEGVRRVGPLAIGTTLFNIFLGEADELSRRLDAELAAWAEDPARPVGDETIALAHSLAGNSATVGFAELSQLARALEHALVRSQALGGGDAEEARLFPAVAGDIRRLLHQFAAGFLKAPRPDLLESLAAHEIEATRRLETARDSQFADSQFADSQFAGSQFGGLGQAELRPFAPLPEVDPLRAAEVSPDAPDAQDDIDAVDAIDAELFPIFEEEGAELLPQLAARLRDWAGAAGDPARAAACMRSLHTIKGGARLAGAMRLGELAHRLEAAIEHVLARGDVQAGDVEALQARGDVLGAAFEALRRSASAAPATSAPAPAASPAPVPVQAAPAQPEPSPPPATPVAAGPAPAPAAAGVTARADGIDWSRFVPAHAGDERAAPPERTAATAVAAVRVRAPVLERMVNHAGEVSIARVRMADEVARMTTSLGDLTENLERLRGQLRDIELQAETQIASRLEAARASGAAFDPLESDRYTRLQELTRMMAESVNDVATVQRTLQRTLQSTEDALAAQGRLTRELQDDLLRTRMVEFESLSERLYRVVRQAAKETGRQVRLDIVGGGIEVDRGVLDRMTGAFEHLLRNSVTHGIEAPEARTAAGKDPTGTITVALAHEGNEVAVEFRDDGQGLDLERIRERGLAQGLLAAGATPDEAQLANLIFTPGFSTAETVTELAGRGIGMDVVRFEVNGMGGRIETSTARGRGTSFRLVLPLTTAVTHVVMLRCGPATPAVPSTLIEIVRRATPAEIEQAYASATYAHADSAVPFFWLGALLGGSARSVEPRRSHAVVVVRSAQQRVALHVDEVLGNQEVVVKALGAQLARLPGVAGITLLASGVPALIYNPVALAAVYGAQARAATLAAMHAAVPEAAQPTAVEERRALVLVVDDSLTVRRVTQRLLQREGYRVALAKDGLDALERLAEEKPDVVLSDIEMPRMDGFDLVRNLRGDDRWRDLPVIMITSRIAQKHRDHAAELGVDHYLGKPYAEDELLGLVARYAGSLTAAA